MTAPLNPPPQSPAAIAYATYQRSHGVIFNTPPWDKLPVAFQENWEAAISAATQCSYVCARAFYDLFCDQREGKDFRGKPLRCWAALLPDTRRAFEDALVVYIKAAAGGEA